MSIQMPFLITIQQKNTEKVSLRKFLRQFLQSLIRIFPGLQHMKTALMQTLKWILEFITAIRTFRFALLIIRKILP